MPRPAEIPGSGLIGNGGLYGGHPVGRRNPGGHAPGGLDGYGKCGPIAARIVFHHHLEPQVLHPFIGQAQTDNAAAFADEHGHLVFGQALGRKNKVALVFPVRIIGHQHSPTHLQRFQSPLDPLLRVAKLHHQITRHGRPPCNTLVWEKGISGHTDRQRSGKPRTASRRKDKR